MLGNKKEPQKQTNKSMANPNLGGKLSKLHNTEESTGWTDSPCAHIRN